MGVAFQSLTDQTALLLLRHHGPAIIAVFPPVNPMLAMAPVGEEFVTPYSTERLVFVLVSAVNAPTVGANRLIVGRLPHRLSFCFIDSGFLVHRSTVFTLVAAAVPESSAGDVAYNVRVKCSPFVIEFEVVQR